MPSHANQSRDSSGGGSRGQIEPLVCDATEVPGENRFDAAVAVDASGYLPRRDWLDRMASLLRPGGSVFIIDCFLEDLKYAELFNSHWHTRIGTIDEYFAAARDSGFKPGSVVDVTDRTVHFWTTTLALIDAESASAGGAKPTATRRRSKPTALCGWSLRRRPTLRHAELLEECGKEGPRAAGALRDRSLILTAGPRLSPAPAL